MAPVISFDTLFLKLHLCLSFSLVFHLYSRCSTSRSCCIGSLRSSSPTEGLSPSLDTHQLRSASANTLWFLHRPFTSQETVQLYLSFSLAAPFLSIVSVFDESEFLQKIYEAENVNLAIGILCFFAAVAIAYLAYRVKPSEKQRQAVVDREYGGLRPDPLGLEPLIEDEDSDDGEEVGMELVL